MNPLLSLDKVAKILGVSKSATRVLLKDIKPVGTVGRGKYLYSRKDVDAVVVKSVKPVARRRSAAPVGPNMARVIELLEAILKAIGGPRGERPRTRERIDVDEVENRLLAHVADRHQVASRDLIRVMFPGRKPNGSHWSIMNRRMEALGWEKKRVTGNGKGSARAIWVSGANKES